MLKQFKSCQVMRAPHYGFENRVPLNPLDYHWIIMIFSHILHISPWKQPFVVLNPASEGRFQRCAGGPCGRQHGDFGPPRGQWSADSRTADAGAAGDWGGSPRACKTERLEPFGARFLEGKWFTIGKCRKQEVKIRALVYDWIFISFWKGNLYIGGRFQ